MREAKTSGGIGHGALSHEDAFGSWFLFIEHTSKVSDVSKVSCYVFHCLSYSYIAAFVHQHEQWNRGASIRARLASCLYAVYSYCMYTIVELRLLGDHNMNIGTTLLLEPIID